MNLLKNKIFYVSIMIVFSISFFLSAGEIIFRIKQYGFKKAIQSIFHKTTQPSVLGTDNWFISDPDIGYRLNPSMPEINKFSMKEKKIQTPKPAGLKRIIILGDSIPYSGNPSFVDLLKNKFSSNSEIEMLNASTPGYTTYQELIFLKKILINAEPDYIILTYCLNDNYTFLHQFDEKANMLWTQEAKDSLAINTPIDKLINKSLFLMTLKTMFIQNINKNKQSLHPWENSIDFNIAWKNYSWPYFDKRIEEMNNIAKNHNSKLFIVIFPLGMQFNKNVLTKNYQLNLKPQRQVKYYCNKYDIPCLDLFPIFYNYSIEHKEKKLFSDGLHLNKDGHNITAEAIYKFLLQNNLSNLSID